MKITVLCTSETHPVNSMLRSWVKKINEHEVELVRSKSELSSGDILFLISCSEIVSSVDRSNYKKTLVIHASDLPEGRGWSPHIWSIIRGETEITVSLLEAEDLVDSGDIWHKITSPIPRYSLYDDINSIIFKIEEELMDFAVDNFSTIVPVAQSDADAEADSYCLKRTPEDSMLDPNKSIAEQFDLIRTCDTNRYPAYFELHGKKFKLVLEKINDEEL